MGDGSCQVLFETDESAVAPVGDASARRSGGAGDAHRSARRSARFGTPGQQIAGLAGGSRHGVDFALLGHSLDIYFGSAVRFDRAPAYGQIGLDFGAAGGREGAAVALAGDLGMCAAGCADVERRGVYDGSAGDPTAAGVRLCSTSGLGTLMRTSQSRMLSISGSIVSSRTPCLSIVVTT